MSERDINPEVIPERENLEDDIMRAFWEENPRWRHLLDYGKPNLVKDNGQSAQVDTEQEHDRYC